MNSVKITDEIEKKQISQTEQEFVLIFQDVEIIGCFIRYHQIENNIPVLFTY